MSIDPGTQAARTTEAFFERRFRQPQFWVALFSHRDGAPVGETYQLNRDILTLQTQKTIGDPAGTWSVTTTIARKPVKGKGATWADIVEPMDYVEINLRSHAVDPWTVVMRGFVDNVRYVDAVSPTDGIPRRRVVINGRDFGKLWLEYKIFYLLELRQIPLDGTGTTQRYWGISPKNWQPGEFLNVIYDKLMAPKIAKLQEKNAQIRLPSVQCSIPNEYRVNGFMSSFETFQGPLWNLMAQYAAAPYTEFLVRDLPGEAAANITWRWAPLLIRGNRLAYPEAAQMPPVRVLHTSEIVNYNVGTSDNDRYTYFWAKPAEYSGTDSSVVSKVTSPGYIDGAGIDLYGYKAFEPAFPLYAWHKDSDSAAGQTAPAFNRDVWNAQLQLLTQWLVDTMIWAVEQFEGDIQAPLRPDLCAGDYVDIPEENRRLYIEGVSHSFTVGQSPSTVLTVTRGLTIDDPNIPTPLGYDPGGGAGSGPIPGGSTTVGPLEPLVPPGAGSEGHTPAPPPAASADGAVQVAAAIIAQGTRYTWGGRTYQAALARNDYAETLAALKRDGTDCSGFATVCYHFGLGAELFAYTQTQYNATYRVPRELLVPGDLCFFEGGSSGIADRITHVGVYVGNGLIANAYNESVGCVYSSIDSGSLKTRFVSGGRLTARNPGGPAAGTGEYTP